MEVSNEIKEDIRKTQTELKNAIRVHQMWVARLHEDENVREGRNIHLKSKVREAEKEIISIGQNQKRVVDRLRRELELYQQRLKARNKQVNVENDNRFVAQQLRDHTLQFRNKNRPVSLLKPSVLNEIHIKTENSNGDLRHSNNDISDSENDLKSLNEKENSNHSEVDDKERYSRSYQVNTVHDSRSNFANALNKVKESFIGAKLQGSDEWPNQRRPSDSDSSPPENNELSPSPSPPPLPDTGEQVSQETFLRLIGLVTWPQKDILEKKRSERRKRSTTSTNRTDFLYGNFDPGVKRKKYNQFPYMQSHNDPPQTRSAKLRKQQLGQKQNEKSSREGSPSGSSSENREKGWNGNKPAWADSLPAGLSVEPVYTSKKVCHGCGRNDVPSLLVRCTMCGVHLHTGCSADGKCTNCQSSLPDPSHLPSPHHDAQLYKDKLAERKRLQERNIQLCVELRKLEARAATLKENMDDHHAEKRHLLADQIKTQRHLHKLLDFVRRFKETSVSMQSTSLSDTTSEISKSNEE